MLIAFLAIAMVAAPVLYCPAAAQDQVLTIWADGTARRSEEVAPEFDEYGVEVVIQQIGLVTSATAHIAGPVASRTSSSAHD